MIREITKYIIQHRDALLSLYHDEKFEKIIQQAKKNWMPYNPTPNKKLNIYGIDSSFNSKKYQGISLWACDVVSINKKSESRSRYFKVGVGLDEQELGTQAALLEIEACKDTTDHVDYVLMDGSLYSHFTTKHTPLKNIVTIINKNHNVIFISKTSRSRSQFKQYNALAGDIFYYNKASRCAGFSKIFIDTSHGSPIATIYARLKEDTPMMKIELSGNHYTDTDIKKILDALASEIIGGYPYCLKLAHNECKIADRDLNNLVSILGLSNEIGSRELLE